MIYLNQNDLWKIKNYVYIYMIDTLNNVLHKMNEWNHSTNFIAIIKKFYIPHGTYFITRYISNGIVVLINKTNYMLSCNDAITHTFIICVNSKLNRWLQESCRLMTRRNLEIFKNCNSLLLLSSSLYIICNT